MTVNAITDTKKGEQGLRLLIYILPQTACQCMKMGRYCMSEIVVGLMDFYYQCWHMHSASLACCLAHTPGLFRAASSVCRAAAASSSVNRRALSHLPVAALCVGWRRWSCGLCRAFFLVGGRWLYSCSRDFYYRFFLNGKYGKTYRVGEAW